MSHEHLVEDEVIFRVLTVSSSRSVETDRSGKTIRRMIDEAGHTVEDRGIVKDVSADIFEYIEGSVASPAGVLIITGGTGISSKDQSVDVLKRLETKELPGFGELFRSLSYNEIGARAILSRARASLVDDTLVFVLPGSTEAVKLGMKELILPAVGHALFEMNKEAGGR